MGLRKSATLFLALFLVTSFSSQTILAGEGSKRGNFPVRDCDESTPFHIIYKVLKAGLEDNPEVGMKEYVRWLMPDRKDKKGMNQVKNREWPNIREQAINYFAHDKYGFKAYVLEMKPAQVTKKTSKVYFTLKNFVFPDERQGLVIVERDSKGNWMLRSISL